MVPLTWDHLVEFVVLKVNEVTPIESKRISRRPEFPIHKLDSEPVSLDSQMTHCLLISRFFKYCHFMFRSLSSIRINRMIINYMNYSLHGNLNNELKCIYLPLKKCSFEVKFHIISNTGNHWKF